MPEEIVKILSFEIERDGDTAVVKCHGRLVLGTSEELYQAVKPLLPQTKVVVVDLADLTYVDSMGLGTLVRLYASARQEGCDFKLLHLGKQLPQCAQDDESPFRLQPGGRPRREHRLIVWDRRLEGCSRLQWGVHGCYCVDVLLSGRKLGQSFLSGRSQVS